MSDFPEVKDHLVANPDKYTMTTNPDGTVTLRPTWVDNPSEVLQEGTPVDAAFLSKIPEAIDAIDTKVTSQLAETAEEVVEVDNRVKKLDKYNTLLDKDYFINSLSPSGIRPLETLFYLPDTTIVFQGIVFAKNSFYVSVLGNNDTGKVVQYNRKGQKLKETAWLGLGHSNDIAYRVFDDRFYVVNGARALTHVYEIDMSATTPTILSDWNLEYLGESAALAMDNDNDVFVVHSRDNNTDGNHRFTFFDAKTKAQIKQFEIPKQGTGTCQGIEVYKGVIYHLTATPASHPRVTMIDFDGNVIGHQIMSVLQTPNGTTEAEGIAVAWQGGTPYIAMGFYENGKNRIYAARPTENASLYNRFAPMTSIARKDGDENLIPRIFTARINNKPGVGQWALSTDNHYFDVANMVENIAIEGTFIVITLKESFASIGFMSAEPDMLMVTKGVDIASEVYVGTMNKIHIRICDAKNNYAILDPATIAQDFGGIKVIVYGAVKQYV